jgi:Na+/phosphate symporter
MSIEVILALVFGVAIGWTICAALITLGGSNGS